MKEHEPVHAIGQSQSETRTPAKAKITVQSSEAKPHDQTTARH